MNLKPPTIALLAGTLLAVQGPAVTLAQTSTFSVKVTIADLEAAYLSGKTTAHAVTQAYLDRIAAYDKRGPLINALITVNPHALEEADRLDAVLKATGRPVGPLHGIPVIVKDNIDVAGLPMTSGFQGWKNYYPPEDAPMVKKIRAAGGIILAKSSLSEFTRGIGDNINSVVSGFARNPYNTAFATGGSSGGTGAALAASFGVVGIGTDTGGSVRMPSAHNALAGLRPTVGLVSRSGMVPLNSVRDTRRSDGSQRHRHGDPARRHCRSRSRRPGHCARRGHRLTDLYAAAEERRAEGCAPGRAAPGVYASGHRSADHRSLRKHARRA